MVQITGSVERVTYYNQENGYSVLRIRPERGHGEKIIGVNLDGLLTVVGNLPELNPGEQIKLEGEFTTNVKHGLQFNATFCEQVLPITINGIESYLGSGLIKGIGAELSKRIVKQFKEKTLEIIENDPDQLKNVPGIGKDRTNKIIKAWGEMKNIKDIMLFLHSHNISTNLAVKIYKTYGDQSLEVVKENPYRLEQDIFGIGFKTADKIAQNLGLPKEHPSRIEAGIIYAIQESINEGHVYIPQNELMDRATELLQTDASHIDQGLKRLEKQDRIKRETEKPGQLSADGNETVPMDHSIIYISALYYCELGVAKSIHLLNASPVKPKQGLLIGSDIGLSEEQLQALDNTLKSPVSVITGGPGTGKTTCLKTLIGVLEDNHLRYALASPTGRAAKRMSETTSRPASTIHRLLAFKPGEGFKHHENNPLKIDILIIDEASMLDIQLAFHLFRAIKPGTQVLLIGDVDQLPSVGAGDVLGSIIRSGKVPVSRLEKIYRQAQDSDIISNAHRINHGKYPNFSSSANGDFHLFPAENAEKAAEWVVDVVCNRIPEKFGIDPINDIQVLTPMYRGTAGVDSLNQMLQDKLNPAHQKKSEQKLFGQTFRVGDKVMQTQNNYDKDVFNGDIGMIENIDKIEQSITVNIDGTRMIKYDFSETDEIVLAYAVTVHKSQGSEFPAVVVPIITQHYIMLQRNLLYTAVTRAQKLCVLIGNPKAIHIAIGNNQYAERYSKLSERLQHD
jgi:exodeoxyribonuclease V alpha subunit